MDNLSVFLIVLLGIIFLPPFLIGLLTKNWKKGVVSALSGITASIVVILLFGLISSVGDFFDWGWTSGPGLGIFVVVFVLPCGYILGLILLPPIMFRSRSKTQQTNSEMVNKFCGSCGKLIIRQEPLSTIAFCSHCGAKLDHE
jgi:uncharacterized membrane protein